MKRYGLPILIGVMSILYLLFIPSQPQSIKLLFKLIPMWLIILYAYYQLPREKKLHHFLLLTGLFFCMLGDGLLIWFVVGLSAFLIGHLFYLSAFFRSWRYSGARAASLLPIALYGVTIGTFLIRAIVRDGHTALLVPVILYIFVISMMTWSAILTGNRWAIAGSILFTLSDSILSWNKFVEAVPHSSILIMTTYYFAQFLMASSLRSLSAKQSRPGTHNGPLETIRR